jgi:hypothetical protein
VRVHMIYFEILSFGDVGLHDEYSASGRRSYHWPCAVLSLGPSA